jgi:hypothetical protein
MNMALQVSSSPHEIVYHPEQGKGNLNSPLDFLSPISGYSPLQVKRYDMSGYDEVPQILKISTKNQGSFIHRSAMLELSGGPVSNALSVMGRSQQQQFDDLVKYFVFWSHD